MRDSDYVVPPSINPPVNHHGLSLGRCNSISRILAFYSVPTVSLLERVRIGMAVLDIEHRPIGLVNALDGERFRVSTYAGDLIWLSPEALFVVDRYTIELICAQDGMERYRAD